MSYTSNEDIIALLKVSSKEDIDAFIDNYISDKRQKHILGVEKMALALADKYGVDIKKTVLAAKAHDIAKELGKSELDSLVKKFNLGEYYLGNGNLSHSKIASEILKRNFKLRDEEVINAVSFHTTGRENMTLLEKIIFTADAIEENRDYEGVEHLRKMAFENLDDTCLSILENTIDYLKRKDVKYIDENSVKAAEWLKKQKLKNIEGEIMDIKETALFIREKIEQRKGDDVTIFDIGSKTSIADYMIIASVSNERLLGAISEYIDDELGKQGITHKNIEGKKESGWILIDYNDIIVNLLTSEMREKYSIEKIWIDCDKLV